jgi:hypothetical protein
MSYLLTMAPGLLRMTESFSLNGVLGSIRALVCYSHVENPAITGIAITENGEGGKDACFEIPGPKGAYRVRGVKSLLLPC